MPTNFEESFYQAALEVVLTTDIEKTRRTQPWLLARIEQLAAVVDRYRAADAVSPENRQARGIRLRDRAGRDV